MRRHKYYIETDLGNLSKSEVGDWIPFHEMYLKEKSLRVVSLYLGISRDTLATYFKKFGLRILTYEETKDMKRARTEATCLDKYGTRNPGLSENIRDKISETCMSKYGGKTPFHNKEIQAKCHESFKNKYLDNPEDFLSVQNKRVKTCNLRYGVSSFSKTFKFKYEVSHKGNPEKVRKFYHDKYGILIEQRLLSRGYRLVDNYSGYKETNKTNYIKYNIEHIPCKTFFESDIRLDTEHDVKCPHCFPRTYGKSQSNLLEFIVGTGVFSLENSRDVIKPLEIDIFIPELNVGFEYNGSVWHSSKFKDKNYHANKSNLCLEKGVRLYHIWEHDDIDIVKSMILGKLGKITNKYFARKLTIKEVNVNERRDFFNSNHLHGDVRAKFALGLYDNDELVSCISFRSHKEGIEIARFATKLNSSVVGGFSKLLKYSKIKCRELGFNKIITYCDRDWTPSHEDSVYFKNGFKFLGDTGCSLSYYNENTKSVEARETYQKHKLEELFPDYDESNVDEFLRSKRIHTLHNSGNWKYELNI